MSWNRLRGSTLMRLAILASLLAVVTLGLFSLLPIPRSTAWPPQRAMTDSAYPVREHEVDEWLPASLSCRRIERFGS